MLVLYRVHVCKGFSCKSVSLRSHLEICVKRKEKILFARLFLAFVGPSSGLDSNGWMDGRLFQHPLHCVSKKRMSCDASGSQFLHHRQVKGGGCLVGRRQETHKKECSSEKLIGGNHTRTHRRLSVHRRQRTINCIIKKWQMGYFAQPSLPWLAFITFFCIFVVFPYWYEWLTNNSRPD